MSMEAFATKVVETTKAVKEQIIDKRLEKNDIKDSSQVKECTNIENRLKSYKDDNGKEHRVGDNLVPNNQYEINGYKYKTDSNGRISTVEGTLHLKHHEGRLKIKDSMDKIGRGEQKKTHDRGHLIGDQFDGSNGLENITAQDSKENKGSYKKLEDQLANEVKTGKDVKVKIELNYDKKSVIPTDRAFHYSIDGEKHIQIFPNGGVEKWKK